MLFGFSGLLITWDMLTKYDSKVLITRTSLLLVILLKYYVMYFGPVAFVYQINKS